MVAQLIDGKKIASAILEQALLRAALLKKNNITPSLGVVLVGSDKPSHRYVAKKGSAAKKIGIGFELIELPSDATTEHVLDAIREMQCKRNVSGLIVQLPLPKHINKDAVLNAIDLDKDVDCLSNASLGRLVSNTAPFVPPTPGAIMSILESLNVAAQGKNITIVGTGALVGKPLALMLINEEASITTVNRHTKNIKEKCLHADILITAVGKKDLIRGDMVKDGAIVIDAGVDFENGIMYGDVAMQDVSKKASYLTPTPGGVGPITVSRLLLNTVIAAEKNV